METEQTSYREWLMQEAGFTAKEVARIENAAMEVLTDESFRQRGFYGVTEDEETGKTVATPPKGALVANPFVEPWKNFLHDSAIKYWFRYCEAHGQSPLKPLGGKHV